MAFTRKRLGDIETITGTDQLKTLTLSDRGDAQTVVLTIMVTSGRAARASSGETETSDFPTELSADPDQEYGPYGLDELFSIYCIGAATIRVTPEYVEGEQ